MSDGLKVTLELDDADFTAGLSRAESGLSRFQQSATRTTPAIRSMDDSSRSFLSTLRDVTVVLGLTHQALGMVEAATTSWVHKIVDVNAEFERMVTIMKTLSSDADPLRGATESVGRLREMAKDAPFSLNAIHNAFIRLQSAGLKPLDGGLKSLMDGVAAFGGTDQELGRAALAMQEMAGKGVVQMKELRNQLMMAIPTASKLMARAFGEFYGEMMKDIHTGTVDAKSTIQGFELELERAFGGAAQRQMETFNGQIGHMAVLLQDLAINNVGKPFAEDGQANANGFFGVIKKQAQDFNDFLASGTAKGLGNMLGEVLTTIVLDIREAIDTVIQFKAEIIAAGEALAIGFGVRAGIGVLNGFVDILRGAGSQLSALRGQWQQFQTVVTNNSVPAALKRQAEIYAEHAAAARAAEEAAMKYHQSQAEAAAIRTFADTQPDTGAATMKANSLRAAQAEAQAELNLVELNASRVTLEAAAMKSAALETEGATSILGRGGKNMLAFLPLLATGLGAVATAAPLVAMGLGFASEYFDIFNTRVKEAWENLVRFGAASRADAEKGDAYIEQQQKHLDLIERRLIVAKENAPAGNSTNAMGEHLDPRDLKDLELQAAAARKNVDALREIQRLKYIEGDQGDAKSGASKLMKSVTEAQEEIRRHYNLDQENAANAYNVANKRLNDSHKDGTLERARYQEADKARQLKLYDDLIGKAKELLAAEDDAAKNGATPGEQSVASEFSRQVKANISDLQKQRQLTADMNMGLELNTKPLNSEEIIKKAVIELAKLREQADGFAAGLRGADPAAEQLAEVWQRMTAGMDQDSVRKNLIDPIKEAKKQADDLNKILRGGEKVDKSYQDIIDKAEARIFELKNASKSDVEKVDIKRAAGEFAGYGGTSPEAERFNELRIRTQQAQTQARAAGSAFQFAFGPALLSMLQNVTGELGKMPNLLGLIIDKANSKMQLQIAPPDLNPTLNGSIMGRSASAPANWLDGIKIAAGSTGGANAAENLLPEVKAALAAMRQTFGEFTLNSTTKGEHERDSEHYKGKAVDLSIAGLDNAGYERLMDAARLAGFTGFGIAFDHLHVDMRNTPSGGPMAFSDGGNMAYGGRDIAGWQAHLNGLGSLPSTAITDESLDAKRSRALADEAERDRLEEKKKIDDVIKGLDNSVTKSDTVIDGYGKNMAALASSIREHGGKAGQPTDINDSFYTDARQKAIAADKAAQEADDQKKAVTKAADSAENTKNTIAAAAEDTANALERLKKGSDAYTESQMKVRRELERNLEKAIVAHPGGGPEVDQARADLTEGTLATRNMQVARDADDAKKKTEAMQLSVLTQTQADDERIRKLKEHYARDLADFTGSEQDKALVAKTFAANIAAEEAQLAAKTPLGKQMQEWGDVTENLQTQVSQYMNTSIETLSTQIVTGKANWQSLSQTILKDMTTMALKAAASGLMSGSGLTGMLSGLGGGMGKVGAPAAGAPMQLLGGGGSKGLFGTHHTGGIIGRGESGPLRMLDFSHFTRAPRFHTGGVIGHDEVPVIARRDEGVFTPGQMKAIGARINGNNHQISVNNNVTLHAAGGSEASNADLAKQVGAHVERISRSVITDELMRQMRPGNMLNP